MSALVGMCRWFTQLACGWPSGCEENLGKNTISTFIGQDNGMIVERWCSSCQLCNPRKSPASARAPLQLMEVTRPFQHVGMDILGPLPETERGNRYILVIGDYFTKWKEAFPMKDMEALTIARLLVNEVICRFGVPDSIHADQGRNFESAVLKEICQLLGIRKTRTTPYHLQFDGLVERFNRILLNMLGIVVMDDEHSWDLHLPMKGNEYPCMLSWCALYSVFYMLH